MKFVKCYCSAMIPDFIKSMSKKDLQAEVRLYSKILNGNRGGVSRPGDSDYERISQEYSWFQEELASRL